MADNRKKNSMHPHNGLFILVGVCLFLMLVSSFSAGFNNAIRSVADTFLMPMQRGMNRLGSYVFERMENLTDLKNVQTENKQLKEELAMLRAENARLKLEVQELDSLRSMLRMEEQYPEYTTVGAHIIGKNSGNWYQSFLIDKGTADGLAVNMNVIADGGLVGIITSIGKNYATVSTIINDGQYVSGMSSRTMEGMIVAGNLTLYADAKISIQNISRNADIKTGDAVVTSNISELYLPGLLIGYVENVAADASRLLQSGTLIPVVNFEELDDVMVITTVKEAGD